MTRSKAPPGIVAQAASLLNRPLFCFISLAPLVAARSLSAAVPGHDDPDVWWVAAAGRESLTTGAVPTRNAFSFVDGAQPWIMHEWLLGPLYAKGLALLGPPFFALLALLVGVLTLWLAAGAIARESRSSLAAWLVLAPLAAFFSDRFVTARPTGVALLFPVALLALVLRRPFGRWGASACVALMLLWTNCHGSFPLGIAILAGGAVLRDERALRLSALALGAAVTLLNPYGAALHRFVIHYLLGDTPVLAVIRRRIAEFSPLFGAAAWSGWELWVGAAWVVMLVSAGILDRKARRRAFLCFPLLVFGMRNARHFELAGILCLLLLVPAANGIAERWGASSGSAARWALAVPVAGAAVGILGWLGGEVVDPKSDALLGAHRPVEQLLPRIPDGAHVYAPFTAASLVTWLGYPRGVLIFADSRNDCFRPTTLDEFFDLETGKTPADLDRLFSDFGVTHALVPDTHPLAASIAASHEFRVVAQDRGWTLFEGPQSTAALDVGHHLPPRAPRARWSRSQAATASASLALRASR